MPKGKQKPPAVTLPVDLDDDDELPAFGTPDDDGWIHLARRTDATAGSSDGGRKKAGKPVSRRTSKVARKTSGRGERKRNHP